MKKRQLFENLDNLVWHPSWYEKMKVEFFGTKFRFKETTEDGFINEIEGYEYDGTYYITHSKVRGAITAELFTDKAMDIYCDHVRRLID